MNRLSLVLGLSVFVASCVPPEPPIELEEPRLRRLTEQQYINSVQDVFGTEIFVPTDNEPDTRSRGFLQVGASSAAISPRGVERFEAAAFTLAEQVMSEEQRTSVLDCALSGEPDDPCAAEEIARLGRLLWRRPLTDTEQASLEVIASSSSAALGDPNEGFQFALAGLLQSPHFLYRVELGTEDSQGRWTRAFTDYELASRLSYLLWNSGPDSELLDAAEAGELSTEEGLDAQTERLLAAPRGREGLVAWFSDMMHLAKLDDLYKDPNVYLHMSDTLGRSAAGESERFFEHLAFEQEADLRDLMTSRTTFLNREMAALYEVRAPAREGYGMAELPADGGRLGLLGQTSFLALEAHPVSTSPTLRGKFVREVLLCQTISPPLADIDTAIPPVTEEAPTLRARVAQHLSDAGCAGCHEPMDNIGLGFENFDGIGRYRTQENGAPIDASGLVDEDAFDDPTELASLLRVHDDFAACLVKSFVRYAGGQGEEEAQLEGLDWLHSAFSARQHSLKGLLDEYLHSAFFSQAGELDPVGPQETAEDTSDE